MRRIHLSILSVLFAATLSARADTISSFSITGHGNDAGPGNNMSVPVTGTTTIDTTTGVVQAISFTVAGSTQSTIDCQTDQGDVFVGGYMSCTYTGSDAQKQMEKMSQYKFTFTDPLVGYKGGTFNLATPSAGNYVGSVLLSSSAVSATPEPSTLALLGTGLLGIVGTVRKRLRA